MLVIILIRKRKKISNSDSSQSDIEENLNDDNNLKFKENLDEDILDDNNNDQNLNNNDINLEENLENKSFSLEIEELEFDDDINIINNSKNDYTKLINFFKEININKEENNNNWFKIPLNERLKLFLIKIIIIGFLEIKKIKNLNISYSI